MLASQPWNASGNESVLLNRHFSKRSRADFEATPGFRGFTSNSGNCGFLEAQQQG
jgi:hypothetical protein